MFSAKSTFAFFVLLVLPACLALASVTNGQSRASADYGKRSGKTVMLAAYDLYDYSPDPSDLIPCTARKYSGSIIKVDYERERGVQIAGFTLRGSRGESPFISIDPSLYDNFNIGLLPTLIRKNNRVRVDAYICGASGRVVLAKNVISLRS